MSSDGPALRSRTAALCGLLALALLGGCAEAVVERPSPLPPEAGPGASEAPLEAILLHMNDVYEITPVEGGRVGGLARVATLRERLLAETPHVLTTLGGDLFSPSAMGTAKVDGVRLEGEQMVAVLGLLGLDWATFGNHEFDVSERAFFARLAESEFGWVSANVTGASGEPLPGVVESATVELGGLRIGLIGGTLLGQYDDYVRVADPLPALAAAARALRPEVDVLVALTHLELEQDVELAESVPEVDLVLGGHEHENWGVRRGTRLTPILKADANARSVYVVRLAFDPASGDLSIRPDLVPITAEIPDDPTVAAEVARWVELADAAFRAEGFDPSEPVTTTDLALDGRASVVRNGSNPLTDLIAEAMLRVVPSADAAVYNSGSIRIDDIVPAGVVSQYDVIRILPFGGDVVSADLGGALLRKVLDQGVANRGEGGYLQYAGIARDPGEAAGAGEAGGWTVGGAPLDDARTYRIALTDFLLTGREDGLGYLTPDNPEVDVAGRHGDIRRAVIAELQRRFGAPGR